MALDHALIEIDRAIGSSKIIREKDILKAYSHDESEVPHCIPDALIRVSSAKEVSDVMKAAYKHEIFVTPRAGGTGRVGGAVPVRGGIVISCEGMNGIDSVQTENQIVQCQPGVITQTLQSKVEEEGLFFPPDPNSLSTCMLGGNIACNAGGPRAFKYGVTRDYVLGLEVVTADGTILKLGKETRKGVTGYDLTALMVGSEGTLGFVTHATLKLLPNPESVLTVLAFLPDIDSIQQSISSSLRQRMVPRCLEFLDVIALDIVRKQAGIQVPEGALSMLLIELDGPDFLLEKETEKLGNILVEAGALEVLVAQNSTEKERLWQARRELSWSMRKQAQYKLSEDVVVPRTHIGQLLERCKTISTKHGIVMPTYGHAGDGNLHVNFLWNDESEWPKVESAIEGLFNSTIEMRGTLSGEHGIGVLKAPYLPLEQSKQVIALQENVKKLFDPKGLLNPGKLFPSQVGQAFHGAC